MYLQSHTLGKPLSTLRRMQECCNELMRASEEESRRGPDDFEYMREDLDDWLENSVTAFTNDMKVFQYAIDRQDARLLIPDRIQMPSASTESEAQAAERIQVQGMSRDELQALLIRKASRNSAFVQ